MNNPPVKMAEVREEEKDIKITFSFDFKTVSNVKTIPGRRYHSNGKYWTCPITDLNLQMLRDFGFTATNAPEATPTQSYTASVPEIKDLGGELMPYQLEGVTFLESRNGRGLIADEMGLGKTVQALAWLQLHPKARPAVIVVPASLKPNWEKEAKAWMSNPKTEILNGKTPHKTKGEILIINYDIVWGWSDYLKALNPQVMVLDEVHLIKSSKTKRTKAVKKIAKGIPHVIGLSGTPVLNRPVEILQSAKLINKDAIPNDWTFLQRYCGAKHTGFGWNFNGASNTEELHKLLTSTIMIRRLKKDVLPQLPDKRRSFVPMEIDNKREYEHAESDLTDYLTKTKGKDAAMRADNAPALATIETLKQIAVQGKMKSVLSWITDFLATGEKLVIMATHKNVISQIMNTFGKEAVKVDGSVTAQARQGAVEAFQNNESVRLFVGNIKAAGVGLTLTRASNLAFIELPWTPGDLNQAEDRIHRIGQKNAVQIWYLLAQGTIEAEIARLLDSKRKTLDAVVDGKETEETSLLSELINKYVKKTAV